MSFEPERHRRSAALVAWPRWRSIAHLPDLDSTAHVNASWDANLMLLKAVTASLSVGLLSFLVFLGGLAEWLRWAGGGLAFTILGSAVTCMTAPNGAIGGIAAPLGLCRAWILSSSDWWLAQDRAARAAPAA